MAASGDQMQEMPPYIVDKESGELLVTGTAKTA
jgi:hypothetical protein